jgi:hypothetical protein
MKVLCGMALRQTTGFIESLLRLIGRDWDVPDFSTLSRRQETLKVNIPYRGSDGRFRQLPQTQCRHLTGGNPPISIADRQPWTPYNSRSCCGTGSARSH